ncbi:MAG: NAD(P)-binding protein [Clostridia bacterium]|nr:NAD(P)-binding protein [Clostridia bacterium]
MLKNRYSAVIIGGGIGGLMAAYGLIQNGVRDILLIEKGHDLINRKCPIITKKSPKCVNCKPCAIMTGLAGAGAFSDGKYVISTEYGGWLTDVLDPKTVIDLIEKADGILVRFGATKDRYMPDNSLKLKCLQHDLHMQQAVLKHLGTDENYNTMLNLINYIRENAEISTDTEVINVDKNTNTVYFQGRETGSVTGGNIIFAVGRFGSRFFSKWCTENKIGLINNQVDIGVRVELPAIVWESFSRVIYEPKILFRSKQYGDYTRMFCFNERGSVVTENTDGVLTVNGHSYRDKERKTENSNFALLTTTRFTQPFKEPTEYARYVASLANKISGGEILVQRFGDLIKGRRTDEKRLNQSTTRPTLKAVPGDLSLCMPKRQLDNIIETLFALDKVSPGTANYDTLLYGVECKYYSARPECDKFLIEGTNGIYAVGDGAGFTRSLSHAAANGLYVSEAISGKKL